MKRWSSSRNATSDQKLLGGLLVWPGQCLWFFWSPTDQIGLTTLFFGGSLQDHRGPLSASVVTKTWKLFHLQSTLVFARWPNVSGSSIT